MKNKKPLIFIFTFALLTGCVSIENRRAPIRRNLFEDNKYIFVTWKNYDGDILRTQRYLKDEDDFTYVGKTPYRAADAQYTYVFEGWSNPQRDRDGNITYVAQYENVINTYYIYWKNYDGTNLEVDRDVPYGTIPTYDSATPTKPATAQYTYTFSGWSPAVQMVTRDQAYIATFTSTVNSYSLTYDPAGGSCSVETETYLYGSAIQLPTPTRKGYTFDGWYDGNTKITDGKTWTYGENKTFTASWSIITYTITYQLDDGTNSSSNPSKYNIESPTIILANPTKNGYTFVGWYDQDGNQVTQIENGSTGSITLTANFSPNQNNLIVTSDDTSKGTVAITFGSGYSGEPTTVVATPAEGCVFTGWYHNDSKVSNNATFTFAMPINDYSLVAHFLTKTESSTIPLLSEDGKTISYGLYPQTNVDNTDLISSLDELTTQESNGWYLFNGDYYAKTIATPRSSCKFDNGLSVASGTTYWFKCEPIEWNILSSSNYSYYVLSDTILDVYYFCYPTSSRVINGQTVYPSNYQHSNIRAWLNDDFYNSAFALGKNKISATSVNNGAATTNSTSNSYACNNTNDKVFLPSYKDYVNPNYGFSTSTDISETRLCRVTDWAKARGAYCDFVLSSFYSGSYFTRSPSSNGELYVWIVGGGGYLTEGYLGQNNGVRPAVTIYKE